MKFIDIQDIRVGDTAVRKAFLGNKLIFQAPDRTLKLHLDFSNVQCYSGGVKIRDLTDNGHIGTIINQVTHNSDLGGYLDFGGGYIDFGNVLNLGTNSMTAILWVKMSDITAVQCFFSKSLAGPQNYRYAASLANGNVRFFMQGDGGRDVLPIFNGRLNIDEWVHIAYIINRSSDISAMKNAELLSAGDRAISRWKGNDFQSINPFRIGCYTGGDNTSTTALFTGSMASFKLYHRVLTQEEIIEDYNSTRGRFINN